MPSTLDQTGLANTELVVERLLAFAVNSGSLCSVVATITSVLALLAAVRRLPGEEQTTTMGGLQTTDYI